MQLFPRAYRNPDGGDTSARPPTDADFLAPPYLHEADKEFPTQQSSPPEPATISAFAEQLSVGLHELRDEVNNLALRLLKTEQRSSREHDHNTGLEDRLRRLESRIDAFLAARTRERPDLATAAHSTHRAIADEYRGLVEQRLQALAREQAKRPEIATKYPEREVVARLISKLCRHLFGDKPVVSTGGVKEDLHIPDGTVAHDILTTVRKTARDLRARSEQAGLTIKWDFGHVSSPVDSARQEAWGSCSPSGRVHFVVAPAYLVNGQVYARQLVFTNDVPEQ